MPPPTYVGSTSGTQGWTGAASVAWPSGHAAGDIGILICETAQEAIATPSGWTEVANSPQGTGTAASTTATRLTIFWKRATSNSEADVSISDAGDHIVASILAFRGCLEAGTPTNVTAGDVETSTTATSVTIPGATTTVNNCLIVMITSVMTDDTITNQYSGSWSNGNVTSLTERKELCLQHGNGGGFMVATGVKAAAGNYGSTTCTLAQGTRQGRISLALAPAKARSAMNLVMPL